MRPWVRQGSVRDQQEMQEVHTLGSFPTVATSLGPGAAPLAFHTRLAAAGVGRSTGYRGVAWQELPCPAQKSPPRPAAPCLHRANSHSPLTKIPSVLFEYCSVSAGMPGDAAPSGIPVLCRAHRGARWVFGWRERVFRSGKTRADRVTEPYPCFQRQHRKALEAGNSQGSDAVWFATPLI